MSSVRERSEEKFADQGNRVRRGVGATGRCPDEAQAPLGSRPKPPFDVQSRVLLKHDVGGGELSADDRPGFVVEGEPDDVEQVGRFLDACSVRQRLQLCRDERSCSATWTVCSLVLPPPTARIRSGVAERRAQS